MPPYAKNPNPYSMRFTENNISATLDLAVSFVAQHCKRNAVNFYRRKPAAETDASVIIVGTDAGNYGSIGWCTTEERIRCFCRNDAKYKWAKLEGFSEEKIYEIFKDEIVKEVSLEEMAALFVGRQP